MKAEWIFDPPPPSGARKGGLANAQVFDPDLDSLVREALQNARDQRAFDDPVRVRIALRELTGSALESFLEAIRWDELRSHIEAAEAEGGVTISERLRQGLGQIASGRLRVLSIDDHGTVGLIGAEDEEESNFNALCRHELVTSSERRQSGGSFGIGKSVLWRFSGLSTVLFGSWLSDEDRMRFFGRALLTSHETDDGPWEGSGWLGEPEKRGNGLRACSLLGDDAQGIADQTLVARKAGDPGTSILVLAFDEPALQEEQSTKEACEAMVKSARRWFWPSMVRDEMQIIVEGWQDDEQVFVKHVNPSDTDVLPFVEARTATPEVHDSLDAPGEVVEREITLSIPAQRADVFDEPRPAVEAPVRLRIRQAESGETEDLNCVALQRGAGMVVEYKEFRVRSNVDFGFHGILEAGLARGDTDADRAVEEFLRAAEPPAHEEWTHKTDRIRAEYSYGAKTALDDLFGGIEAAIREFVREETVETDEGPGCPPQAIPASWPRSSRADPLLSTEGRKRFDRRRALEIRRRLRPARRDRRRVAVQAPAPARPGDRWCRRRGRRGGSRRHPGRSRLRDQRPWAGRILRRHCACGEDRSILRGIERSYLGPSGRRAGQGPAEARHQGPRAGRRAMSHVEFYPYPTAPDGLVLKCEVDRDEAVVEDHRVLLQGVPDGETVNLAAEVTIADDVFDRVLPEPERGDPPVTLVVLVRSLSSRLRRAVSLTKTDGGAWTGTVELPKPDLYQAVEIEPVLARRSRGDGDGYAGHPGARLAWGPPVKVEVDDLPVPAGGYLEVQWDDFRTSTRPRLKARPGLLYMLDTEQDPPMLWLNSGIEHFKAVAHARGPRGRNIRVRDATFDTIVSQVWTSLVSVVIARLAAAMTAEPEADAALESLTDWETRVVHFWAQGLVPEAGSKGEAVRELAERAGTPELLADLHERIGAAVQEQARTAYAFRGLIRLRDNEGV